MESDFFSEVDQTLKIEMPMAQARELTQKNGSIIIPFNSLQNSWNLNFALNVIKQSKWSYASKLYATILMS